ncbi:hypothetical protein [Microseira sp. BLCC-F43]|uniref:hypothetical protein n=1 Tax=Microseira sp. BLCC-F43 TaxID=3153602 RepID=UPI0035B91263
MEILFHSDRYWGVVGWRSQSILSDWVYLYAQIQASPSSVSSENGNSQALP